MAYIFSNTILAIIRYNFNKRNTRGNALFDSLKNGRRRKRNYTMNESSITLLDFESEAGDLFTFELTQIIPVRK